MKVLLATAYWPNIHYFFYVLNAKEILIEQHEHYQKQSFRNRTEILTANGLLPLSVPVQKNGIKEFTKDVRISYRENWQLNHWRTLESAYKNSPYFDFFEDEIKFFYNQQFDNLMAYNQLQMQTILKLLRLKKNCVSPIIFIRHQNRVLKTSVQGSILKLISAMMGALANCLAALITRPSKTSCLSSPTSAYSTSCLTRDSKQSPTFSYDCYWRMFVNYLTAGRRFNT